MALVTAVIAALPVGPTLAAWRERVVRDTRQPAVAWGAATISAVSLLLVLALSIVQVAAQTYNPFIYFRF